MAERQTPDCPVSSSGATVTQQTQQAAAPDPEPKKRMKRRRTRSTPNNSPSPHRGFFVPGFEQAGSGFKMMSLTEVMDATRGLTNMYLAHEIAIDQDFMLEKLQPDVGGVETQVRSIVHQAFWDVLAVELREDPPVFTRALSLIAELRQHLIGLLLPSQHRIRDSIMEKLDLELIAQQANNASLDVGAYSAYILDMMGKLCAPARDEEIAGLKQQKDLVLLLRGIFTTLEHMKLDMANFMVQQARPLIMSHSVEYEKLKFKEFVALQQDGLMHTKAWLLRHVRDHKEQDHHQPPELRSRKLVINRILNDAFLQLLEWDEECHMLPETLTMDAKRVFALRDATERAAVSTAVILLLFSNVSGFVVPADANKLKISIKEHIDVLLQDFYDDLQLLGILPNVALQVIKDVNEYLSAKGKEPLPQSVEKTLMDQILEMEDPNHRVRDLVQRRIVAFNKQAICTARSAPLQVPPGLTLCQKELAHIAGNFVRLIAYNRAVFEEFYTDIIENQLLECDTATTTAERRRES